MQVRCKRLAAALVEAEITSKRIAHCAAWRVVFLRSVPSASFLAAQHYKLTLRSIKVNEAGPGASSKNQSVCGQCARAIGKNRHPLR